MGCFIQDRKRHSFTERFHLPTTRKVNKHASLQWIGYKCTPSSRIRHIQNNCLSQPVSHPYSPQSSCAGAVPGTNGAKDILTPRHCSRCFSPSSSSLPTWVLPLILRDSETTNQKTLQKNQPLPLPDLSPLPKHEQRVEIALSLLLVTDFLDHGRQGHTAIDLCEMEMTAKGPTSMCLHFLKSAYWRPRE